MFNLFLGLFISLGVALYAYKKGSLSKSGLAGATIYGTSLYFFGGILFLITMLFFFVSSSLLSKYKHREKQSIVKIHEKGDKRDYTQVIANGLPSFIFALLFYVTKSHVYSLGFATCLAAANADTWASELGVLSQKKPVSILSGKIMDSGMSGGITLMGTLASFFGGLVIALVFVMGSYFWEPSLFSNYFLVLFLCTLGGFLGSIIDSALGISMQGIYTDEKGSLTEKRFSAFGENELNRGFSFMNNNLVNLLSGALSATLVTIFFSIIK